MKQDSMPEALFVRRLGREEGPFTYEDIVSHVRERLLDLNTEVRYEGGTWFRLSELPGMFSKRSWILTLALAFLLPGIDRMYLGKWVSGFFKLITLGGLGLWWLIDLILILTNKMKDAEGMPLRQV